MQTEGLEPLLNNYSAFQSNNRASNQVQSPPKQAARVAAWSHTHRARICDGEEASPPPPTSSLGLTTTG